MSQFPLSPPPVQFAPQRLSSVLTPLFKFGFAGVLLALLITACVSILLTWPGGANSWLHAAILLLLALVLLYFVHLLARLKTVVACSDGLLVGNYLTQVEVPYEDIQEIRAYRPSSFVFVRLRLARPCRYGSNIHFELPSRLERIENQPEIELLLTQCPRLGLISRGWWTVLYRAQVAAD